MTSTDLTATDTTADQAGAGPAMASQAPRGQETSGQEISGQKPSGQETSGVEARRARLRAAAREAFQDETAAEAWLTATHRALGAAPIEAVAADGRFDHALAALGEAKRQNDEIGAIAGRLSKRFLETAGEADRRLVAAAQLARMERLAERFGD